MNVHDHVLCDGARCSDRPHCVECGALLDGLASASLPAATSATARGDVGGLRRSLPGSSGIEDWGLVLRAVCVCGDVIILSKVATDAQMLRSSDQHARTWSHQAFRYSTPITSEVEAL